MLKTMHVSKSFASTEPAYVTQSESVCFLNISVYQTDCYILDVVIQESSV